MNLLAPGAVERLDKAPYLFPAALTVFFAYATGDFEWIKAFGLGMGIAIVVDAGIIRTLLVPATMRLLGDRNWWAPAPLAALHDRLGLAENGGDLHLPVHGHATAPVPVGE